MVRELDIVLFGATGFTGSRTIPQLVKFTKLKNLSWAVAGRSEKKLRDVLQKYENKLGLSLKDVPVIIANTEDQRSVNAMARRAQIVLNCCGPYRLYGEPVVKACVEEGTHYVDVTGEPAFMEKMQLKYHEQAREKGVYIISACGFDSIPSDLGVVFLEQQFKGTLNSATVYLSTIEREPLDGCSFNYATWESAILGFQHADELKGLRKQLFKTKLPKLEPELSLTHYPHQVETIEGWAVPFLGADRSVLKRSQRYFYELDSKRPTQVECYMIFKSETSILKSELLVPIAALLISSEFGRNLLLEYPEQFSAGLFSRDEPTDEKLDKIDFCVDIFGEGWKETLPNPEDQFPVPPNRVIKVQVTGSNPSYGSTSVCLTLAALTILTEREKLPRQGGVYPPGYAFARTSLIKQLNENGIKFAVVYQRDVPTSKY